MTLDLSCTCILTSLACGIGSRARGSLSFRQYLRATFTSFVQFSRSNSNEEGEPRPSPSTAKMPPANDAASVSSRTMTEADSSHQPLERHRTVSHFRLVASQSLVTPAVLSHHYSGSGTDEDPYLVEFIPHDPRNPMLFSPLKKWSITIMMAFVTLAVAFVSSAYSGGVKQIIEEFGASSEVVVLGISLFVLGFAIGPLLWAPMSEMYGRQVLLFCTYAALTAFNAGAAGSQNIETLIILRFWAGAFGSSPLTNAGGVIADMFSAKERGRALAIFAAAPFLGPAVRTALLSLHGRMGIVIKG